MKISLYIKIFTTFCLLSLCSSAKAISFDFWYSNIGHTEKAIRSLCDEFNARQNQYTVRCIGQGGHVNKSMKAIAAYRAHNQPAIIQLFDISTTDAIMSNAMIPISDLMSSYGYNIDWSDYLKPAVNYYSDSSGKLYALPFNISTVVMYTNDNILRNAGVSTIPSTWENFGKTLQNLKRSGVKCPYVFNLNPWVYLEQFSAIHGLPIADLNNGYQGLSTHYVFNHRLTQRMMTDLKYWYNQKLALIPPGSNNNSEYIRAFTSGQCAFLITSTSAYSAIHLTAKAKNFHFSIHPVPHYQNIQAHNTLVGGGALWVMRGFDKEIYEGVSAFIHFISEPERQVTFSNATGYLPTTHIAKSKILSSCKNITVCDLIHVATSELNQKGNENTKGIHLGFYIRFRAVWTEEMEKAFYGQQTIEQAMEQVVYRGDALLRRFKKIYQVKRPD